MGVTIISAASMLSRASSAAGAHPQQALPAATCRPHVGLRPAPAAFVVAFARPSGPASTSCSCSAACSHSINICSSSGSSSCRRRQVSCGAAPSLKSAAAGQVDAVYLQGAQFLKSLGFGNTAEIARVLDIAMNPDSLFLSTSKNPLARPLSAEEDMLPVVEFLRSQGLENTQVVQVIAAHPPVLCYNVAERLAPFWEYLTSIGVGDVAAAVVQRPSLLGLDVDQNLRKIVDYLQYVDTPPDKIVAIITKSI